MTERHKGPEGTEENVRDELNEAAERGRPKKKASRKAVEQEEKASESGGVKDNVRDEWDESQRH